MLILGAGGHGKVVCDCLTAAGQLVCGWIDDDPMLTGTVVHGYRVLGTRRQIPTLLRRSRAAVIIAIGDNRLRGRVFGELEAQGVEFVNAVHPSSVIAPSVRLGRGVVVCPGVVINAGSVIGDNVIINTGASVDHDNRIERDAHLSPGVHTGGFARVGRGAHIGLGAVILPRCGVGAYTAVGAGAVVHRDLPARVVAVGIPARVARRVRS